MTLSFSDVLRFDMLSVLEVSRYFFVKPAITCSNYAFTLSNPKNMKKTPFQFPK